MQRMPPPTNEQRRGRLERRAHPTDLRRSNSLVGNITDGLKNALDASIVSFDDNIIKPIGGAFNERRNSCDNRTYSSAPPATATSSAATNTRKATLRRRHSCDDLSLRYFSASDRAQHIAKDDRLQTLLKQEVRRSGSVTVAAYKAVVQEFLYSDVVEEGMHLSAHHAEENAAAAAGGTGSKRGLFGGMGFSGKKTPEIVTSSNTPSDLNKSFKSDCAHCRKLNTSSSRRWSGGHVSNYSPHGVPNLESNFLSNMTIYKRGNSTGNQSSVDESSIDDSAHTMPISYPASITAATNNPLTCIYCQKQNASKRWIGGHMKNYMSGGGGSGNKSYRRFSMDESDSNRMMWSLGDTSHTALSDTFHTVHTAPLKGESSHDSNSPKSMYDKTNIAPRRISEPKKLSDEEYESLFQYQQQEQQGLGNSDESSSIETGHETQKSYPKVMALLLGAKSDDDDKGTDVREVDNHYEEEGAATNAAIGNANKEYDATTNALQIEHQHQLHESNQNSSCAVKSFQDSFTSSGADDYEEEWDNWLPWPKSNDAEEEDAKLSTDNTDIEDKSITHKTLHSSSNEDSDEVDTSEDGEEAWLPWPEQR